MASKKKNTDLILRQYDDHAITKGDTFSIPDGMDLKDAITSLMRKMKDEEETVAIHETVNAYPLDGAYQMMHVMREMFGWASAIPTPGFFGPKPPVLVDLDIGYGKTAQVLWGSFAVPGLGDAMLKTGATMGPDGQPQFVISGTAKQKYRTKIKHMADGVRARVKTHSVYKAKAVRLTTTDEGNVDFEKAPKFLDCSNVNAQELTFSAEVQAQIETSLFTPIKKTALCRANRIPLKRGVLLEGPYGCGKTLTAFVTADLCEKNGWTFIYLDRVSGLKGALQFASMYGPAVIFAEDIDRVVQGDRSVKIDDILNQIDGIESKAQEVIVILTTNYVEKIEKAMIRPGRLDAVITVSPPDAEAAARLVRIYARDLIDPDTDLTHVGIQLAGQIPAVIREVVERAKLYSISRLDTITTDFKLSGTDVMLATREMKRHLELMAPAEKPVHSPESAVGASISAIVTRELTSHVNGVITKRLDKISEQIANQ